MEILLWLTVKHFICDFPLQAYPWMYRNKGSYGHPGGVVHASIHGIGTMIVFLLFVPGVAALFAMADAIAHYHIDWWKMRIGEHFNLKPDNSEWFWILLGLDQLLHYMTYFAMAAYSL